MPPPSLTPLPLNQAWHYCRGCMRCHLVARTSLVTVLRCTAYLSARDSLLLMTLNNAPLPAANTAKPSANAVYAVRYP